MSTLAKATYAAYEGTVAQWLKNSIPSAIQFVLVLSTFPCTIINYRAPMGYDNASDIKTSLRLSQNLLKKPQIELLVRKKRQ